MNMHNRCLVIISNSSNSFLNNAAVGAFLGAFFTFIFALWTYRYTKKHEFWMKHKRATVLTEHLMNRHLNEISDNAYLAEGSISLLSSENFTYNEFHQLPVPEIMIDFQNLDLINKYADYEADIHKLNNDMQSWNRANKGLWEALISGKIDIESSKQNVSHLIKQAQMISRFLKATLEDTYSLGAYVRVFMRKDKFDRFGRLEKTNEIKLSDEEVTLERKDFIKQSKDTMKKSREKIEKIMQG
jgi:hypothetical protein